MERSHYSLGKCWVGLIQWQGPGRFPNGKTEIYSTPFDTEREARDWVDEQLRLDANWHNRGKVIHALQQKGDKGKRKSAMFWLN